MTAKAAKTENISRLKSQYFRPLKQVSMPLTLATNYFTVVPRMIRVTTTFEFALES
jgi:hypothetical protein